MSLTTAGQAVASPNPKLKKISIRQAHLRDAADIGRIVGNVYHDAGTTAFIAPHREKYPAQYIRAFQERALAHMLDARYLSFVATVDGEDGDGEVLVGEAQFRREGEDAGAKTQINQRWSLWLVLGAWLFWAWTKTSGFVFGGNRSIDKARMTAFANGQVRHANIWAKWPNRWYADSVVVDEKFQGRGIGKMLMGEIIWRAKAEGVVVALESSGNGERLYRSLGFKLLERFDLVEGLSEEAYGLRGGFMIWEQDSLGSWTQ